MKLGPTPPDIYNLLRLLPYARSRSSSSNPIASISSRESNSSFSLEVLRSAIWCSVGFEITVLTTKAMTCGGDRHGSTQSHPRRGTLHPRIFLYFLLCQVNYQAEILSSSLSLSSSFSFLFFHSSFSSLSFASASTCHAGTVALLVL